MSTSMLFANDYELRAVGTGPFIVGGVEPNSDELVINSNREQRLELSLLRDAWIYGIGYGTMDIGYTLSQRSDRPSFGHFYSAKYNFPFLKIGRIMHSQTSVKLELLGRVGHGRLRFKEKGGTEERKLNANMVGFEGNLIYTFKTNIFVLIGSGFRLYDISTFRFKDHKFKGSEFDSDGYTSVGLGFSFK